MTTIRIVLEATGEHRIPRDNEPYLYDGELYTWSDCEEADATVKPEKFTILRRVEG